MATKTLPEILPETLPESPDEFVTQDSKGKTAYLPLYRVIMWDDSVTTMEFVVRMLVKIFGKDYNNAEKLMYEIHISGHSHVETLPLERAEFKVEQVYTAASMENFPFKCTIEPL